jgi:SRSO17 transposase
VWAPDETGDLKKGVQMVGTQKQHTGAVGQIENAQAGVSLAYASRRAGADGPAASPTRVLERGPDGGRRSTGRAVRDQAATARGLDRRGARRRATVEAVPADEVYGNSRAFRARLRSRGVRFNLAVSCASRVPIDAGKVRLCADQIADDLPRHAPHERSPGPDQRVHAGIGRCGWS